MIQSSVADTGRLGGEDSLGQVLPPLNPQELIYSTEDLWKSQFPLMGLVQGSRETADVQELRQGNQQDAANKGAGQGRPRIPSKQTHFPGQSVLSSARLILGNPTSPAFATRRSGSYQRTSRGEALISFSLPVDRRLRRP
jgi:hypothetical protein